MIIFPTPEVLEIEGVETRALRRVTADFIAADPRAISLYRFLKDSNGRGGWIAGSRVDIFEQIFRLIPADTQGAARTERTLPEGQVVLPEWILMGKHDCEMRRGDRFDMAEGVVAEIVYVQDNRRYQTKGEVVLRGEG